MLTAGELEVVKGSAKKLLSHLHDKLVLDWRSKADASAAVFIAIKRSLDEDLPEDPYPPAVFEAKVQVVYNHVLAAYGDDGTSVYTMSALPAGGNAADVSAYHSTSTASPTPS